MKQQKIQVYLTDAEHDLLKLISYETKVSMTGLLSSAFVKVHGYVPVADVLFGLCFNDETVAIGSGQDDSYFFVVLPGDQTETINSLGRLPVLPLDDTVSTIAWCDTLEDCVARTISLLQKNNALNDETLRHLRSFYGLPANSDSLTGDNK